MASMVAIQKVFSFCFAKTKENLLYKSVVSKLRDHMLIELWSIDRSKHYIVIGHLRRAAGKFLGPTGIPVHVARDLKPAPIRGLRLADNRTNQQASWDVTLLA
jgi:hypothetical protein